MIISHKYKFVFIHIPKTGGTWTKTTLLKIDPDAINLALDPWNRANSGHYKFHEVQDLEIYDEIKSYLFFAIMRHPLKRLVSYYNFIKGLPEHYMYPSLGEKTFEQSQPALAPISPLMMWLKNKDGAIQKDIKILTLKNIGKQLQQTLYDCGVPASLTKQIEKRASKKLNESKAFIKYEDLDISQFDLSLLHIEDLVYYLMQED
jgi:hypothetical protein